MTAWEMRKYEVVRLVVLGLLLAVGLWAINAGYGQLSLPVGSGCSVLDWRNVRLPWNYFVAGVVLLLIAQRTTGMRWRATSVAVVSLFYLASFQYEALVYLVLTVPVMHWVLGRGPVLTKWSSWRFFTALTLFFLVTPKLYNFFPQLDWMPRSEILFQGIFLRYCYLYYERIKGIAPAYGLLEHAAYLVFIPQVHGILNFSPSEMSCSRYSVRQLGQVVQSLLLAGIKIASLLALDCHVLRDFGYHLGGSHLAELDVSGLWVAMLANYIAWFLRLSTSFDLMTAIVRMFGVPVENSFRWALLAASPIELWRRWNIYNRKLLLKFIYFPLGGSHHYLYRNVLVTFLSSALLLHSGWFGGPWLYPNPARLLDECLYFLLQGLLVCGVLAIRKLAAQIAPQCFATDETSDPFAQSTVEHPLRRLLNGRPASLCLRCGGIVFTLCVSSWCHAIILMSGHKIPFDPSDAPSLAGRLRLMARAVGFDF